MRDREFVCKDCATRYPSRRVAQGEHEEYVFDFRIHRPTYCVPGGWEKWSEVQREYAAYHKSRHSSDNLQSYLDEIDSVKEIYTEEFSIKGRVLDVGGHQGRLRHFLTDNDVPLYVSVDPYLEVFQNIVLQPNLLKAYPCLSKPCNFLACHAENLPFVKDTFDWVHMRSVLDHLQDPYLALKEAYRVLKAGGTLLIGLTVRGGKSSLKVDNDASVVSRSFLVRVTRTIRRAGLKGLTRAVVARMRRTEKRTDDHTFHWNYEDLIDLLYITSFDIVKEHWQKPPFTMCIYLSAIAN
jgi:SAM-dependent methyltransferase